MKHLTHSFVDVLTNRERRLYLKYSSCMELSPYEETIFKAIVVKRDKYKKEKEWAEGLARGVIQGILPVKNTKGEKSTVLQSAESILYEAMVWGMTH